MPRPVSPLAARTLRQARNVRLLAAAAARRRRRCRSRRAGIPRSTSPVAASSAWITPRGFGRYITPSWTSGVACCEPVSSIDHDQASCSCSDVLTRDLVERAVAPRVVGAPPVQPVAGRRIAQHRLGDRTEVSVLRRQEEARSKGSGSPIRCSPSSRSSVEHVTQSHEAPRSATRRDHAPQVTKVNGNVNGNKRYCRGEADTGV